MKYLAILAILAALLVSCGGPQAISDPTAAVVSPVPVADAPTAVPTPLPLDQIDLVAVLNAATTYPKGLSAGETKPKAPKYVADVPRPVAVNAATQYLLHGSDPAGMIVVSLFKDEATVNEAFTTEKGLMDMVSQQSGDKIIEVPDIGKQALATTSTMAIPGTSLMFIRCRAFVQIYMIGDLVDNKSVAAYAKDLDEHLTPAICS